MKDQTSSMQLHFILFKGYWINYCLHVFCVLFSFPSFHPPNFPFTFFLYCLVFLLVASSLTFISFSIPSFFLFSVHPPYLTLPTLPYPHLTLPYPTLPYPILPYPTLTLPYPHLTLSFIDFSILFSFFFFSVHSPHLYRFSLGIKCHEVFLGPDKTYLRFRQLLTDLIESASCEIKDYTGWKLLILPDIMHNYHILFRGLSYYSTFIALQFFPLNLYHNTFLKLILHELIL